ncbi:MAG: class I SAM-dependent methyltransferase [Nitrospinota bacterium]
MDSKTDKSYWDRCWNQEPLPRPLKLSDYGLRNHIRLSIHNYFCHVFSIAGLETHGASIVEIGCGRSIWLPYFEKEFGFRVTGVDYSEEGCAQARQLFERQNMETSVEFVCGDAFEVANLMDSRFDVIFTNGFIEHFTQTSEAISSLARYIRPGGVMISIIPNLSGTLGFLQRLLDREVYEVHVPLDARQLAVAHQDAGLEVIESRYLITMGYNILNPSRLSTRSVVNGLKKAMFYVLIAGSAAVWSLEILFGKQMPSRTFSPYIAVIAKRPATGVPK